MQLPPWEYLFTAFGSQTFPDLFGWTWVMSLVLFVGTIVLYNVRTRQLRRHAVYLEMYEWLLWTGVVVFGLLLIYAVFRFDFIFVLLTEIVGLATLWWIRFRRFPPILAAYERQLAKQRHYSRQKFTHPESTIRTKQSRRKRRR